jgi:ATP:ADP antiporter, AAA family
MTMSTEKKSGMLAGFMKTLSKIEPNELKASFASFGFVFILMASYYILKPVRDAMASDWSDAEVATLWTINFFLTFIVTFLYGAALSVSRLKVVVPGVYAFFALTFIVFAIGNGQVTDPTLVDKAFYVWVSLFALFHVSVFWSFMADLFNKEQAKRLFGFIATGASVGGLVGPLVAIVLAEYISNNAIIIVAALMLVGVMPLIPYLEKLKATELGNAGLDGGAGQKSIGGNPFAGFTTFIRSPFLLGIGLFLLLYTSIGSFIYFELKNLLEVYPRGTRTQIQSGINWAVNFFTIVTAVVATSRLTTRFGLGVTLALIPAVMAGGLVTLAILPVVWLVIFLRVTLNAGNYAITRPAREMLFTLVDREVRYKTKPVIDTVVYRGGDTLNSWAFAGLTEGIGLSMSIVALIGAVIAAIWAVTGASLGRVYNKEKKAPTPDVTSPVSITQKV